MCMFNRRLKKENNNEDDFHVMVGAAAIKNLFDSVATSIIAKATAVVQLSGETPDKVLLVGGLGCNPYLKDQIKKAFLGSTLLAPAHACSAVVAGEPLCGHLV